MSEHEPDFNFEVEEFNPYQTLNVSPDASIEDIQESYKRLSKTFHPDRHSNNVHDAATADSLRQQFTSITLAKQILCDSQYRSAYDHFGLKGVQMMKQEHLKDVRSLQLSKPYRKDDAVVHLLKYHLKREATLDLDRLLSAYGRCEAGIDATAFYEEFTDVLFRRQSLPQFFNHLWYGQPILQLVLDESALMQAAYEPVQVVDDDYDFESEEQLTPHVHNDDDDDNDNVFDLFDADFGDDDDDDGDTQDLSMSEVMNKSLEEQLSIIQTALESGDLSALKNIPVSRHSFRPKVHSFMVLLGYQFEYDDNNTWTVSTTSYADDIGNKNKLYYMLSCEWHHTLDRYTKLVTALSVGMHALASRLTITKNLRPGLHVDVGLHFNFMDVFWQSFGRLFADDFEQSPNEDNAAQALSLQNTDFDSSNKAVWRVVPELFYLSRSMFRSLFNLVRNSAQIVAQNLRNGTQWLYPGFDISFGVRQLLWNQWMGLSSVRLGRYPTFSWQVFKNAGSKYWNVGFDVGRNSFALTCKHETALRLDKTVKLYVTLALDVVNLVKIECGFRKMFIDADLQQMYDVFDSKRGKQSEAEPSNIDMSSSLALAISLKQGISTRVGVKRGISSFEVPIRLSQDSSNIGQLLFSCSIPLLTYVGYKWYLRPYTQHAHDARVEATLNEDGKLLLNKRRYALQLQSVMAKKADASVKMQSHKNGLVILCAFYGASVEKKVLYALRKYLRLDDDDEDGKEEKNDDEHGNEEDDQDGDEELKNENEEEKQENLVDNEATDDGHTVQPPLFFDVNNERRKKNKSSSRQKKKPIRADKYRIQLSDVQWLAIEHELEHLMKSEDDTDIHLVPFLNVRTVLQYMVSDELSTLQLTSGDKSSLPGFYNCCPDQESMTELFVVYQFQTQCRYTTISNMFPLTLPNESHREWVNCRHS